MKRKNKQQNSQGIQNIEKPRPEELQNVQSTSRKDPNWNKPQIMQGQYKDMYAPYPLSQQSQLPLMQPFGQNGLSFNGLLLGSTPKDVLSQIRAGAVENYQGWGEPKAMSAALKLQIQTGATRSVYVGELDKTILEQKLTGQMVKYGAMEGVRMIKEKECAFVDYLSIASAVHCVSELSYAKDWKSNPVRFSKDPCVGHSLNAAKAEFNPPPTFGFDPLGHSLVASLDLKAPVNGGMVPRTIYIAHLPPGTTYEDICDVVRGSHVLKVKLMSEKHIAFVSFVDESAAALAVNLDKTQGMIIKHRKVKVRWSKPSAIPDEIAQAIEKGATRNVYVGGMGDEVTDEKLRNDFEGFGEIERMNRVKGKKCVFVNFTSIKSAVAGIQSKIKEYRSLRVTYGKDRCAHPPRMKENVDHEKSKVESKPENEEIKESEREAKEEDEMKIANEERGEKKEQNQTVK
ncbi:hypothetical protein G6F29_004160 [Rhizopus arrhizus]|nr:hypothetical protein G6F29_004160 [Rhizopus arrhizus]KAG1027231.1 hypothetical protein G6F26_003614 [Rhizopus arrhizus]KAG1038449.1 hypothetical protein G6F25_006365 [Rhizopus arrhizus]KAG1068179.1 hypothetical protein G6F41_007064 [Rhizopus arrhizus]KAG1335685.1 hypothetical protein G6F63_010004 [Rhizopus arrhizus]